MSIVDKALLLILVGSVLGGLIGSGITVLCMTVFRKK